MVLICPFISQATFVVLTVSVVRITNVSLSVCNVMVTRTVKMDQMRKIAVVRMFLFFPSFVMLILCSNDTEFISHFGNGEVTGA